MSTYVMSDLHGCKHEFDEMLKQIEFSEYDTVYILGDIGDRGKESIPLLQEIMSHPNIHVIMGNHDAWLAKYCQELIEIKKDCNTVDMTDDFLCWLHYNGGYTTADQFMDLPFPDCYDIKVYLENIPYYKIIEVHGKKFVLIHAGLSEEYMHKDTSLPAVPKEILIWNQCALEANPFDASTMIVGHVPTFLYHPKYEGKILTSKSKKTIHIDCGCVYGRALGCLRLDDLKEFYVPSSYPYIPYSCTCCENEED